MTRSLETALGGLSRRTMRSIPKSMVKSRSFLEIPSHLAVPETSYVGKMRRFNEGEESAEPLGLASESYGNGKRRYGKEK
jgi:hypothetical protein